jgi:peptidyl-tRNA hydrolase
MDKGKIASQAGHAFLGAFVNCKDQIALQSYHQDFPKSPGTKICLQVPDIAQLYRIENEARAAGLSTYVVVDSGCANFFNGQPTVTALGIGPATREQIQHITQFCKLL